MVEASINNTIHFDIWILFCLETHFFGAALFRFSMSRAVTCALSLGSHFEVWVQTTSTSSQASQLGMKLTNREVWYMFHPLSHVRGKEYSVGSSLLWTWCCRAPLAVATGRGRIADCWMIDWLPSTAVALSFSAIALVAAVLLLVID